MQVNNKSIQMTIKKFNCLLRHQLEKISEKFDLKYLLAVLNFSFVFKYLNNGIILSFFYIFDRCIHKPACCWREIMLDAGHHFVKISVQKTGEVIRTFKR